MTRFHLIGGGRRTDFFLKIARALPGHFQVGGVLVRDPAKRAALGQRWGVTVAGTLDELSALAPVDFTLLAVERSAAPGWLAELAARSIPVLTETPPAADVAGLEQVHALVRAGARIQVAEQYHVQPWHAARQALVASGRLGTIRHVQVAVAHGYHGVSLIRRLLGAGLDGAKIQAKQFELPGTSTDGKGPARQTIATLGFAQGTAVFDFCSDQYSSPVRTPRVLVRGDRGEIATRDLRWLTAKGETVAMDLRREMSGTDGNPGGYALRGITAGAEWLYRNPFGEAALGDDEIAGATALAGMGRYVGGGPEFYPVAEAAQDHYLALLIDQSAASGREIVAEPRAWISRP
jgi:predicted dehydrogenase